MRRRKGGGQSTCNAGARHAPRPKNKTVRYLLSAVWPTEAGWPHLESKAPRSSSTGCRAATPIAHLHHEVMELPVEPHVHMLGAQFLASTLRTSHCSHEVVRSDPGPRRMKHTLLTKYQDVVSPFLSNGILS